MTYKAHDKSLAATVPVLSGVILLCAPFLLSFLNIGSKTIFGVFAADSMYFLTIAKNTVAKGFVTFNQETVTNGFQPLWQYILILSQYLLRLSVSDQLVFTFFLSLLLVLAGFLAAIIGVSKYWGTKEALIASLLMVPGVFAIFFEPSLGYTIPDPALLYSFTSWAFVNGVESPLTVFSIGLLFLTILSRLSYLNSSIATPREVFSLNARLLLAIIVLARLDDIFLLAGFSLAILLFDRQTLYYRIKDLTIVFLPAFALVVMYLAYNVATTGMLLPLSGLTKMQFDLVCNMSQVISLLRTFGAGPAARLIPMLTFLIIGGSAVLYIPVHLHNNRSTITPRDHNLLVYLALPLFAYLFLKAAFHLSLVPMWEQGWWYYTGQIFAFNFLFAFSVSQFAARKAVFFPVLLLCLIIATVQVVDAGGRLSKVRGYAQTNFMLWKNSAILREKLRHIDPQMKLIDNTDGLYGFILDMPVASVTGLVFSKEELQDSREKGGKVRALVARGFNVIPLLEKSSWQAHYIQKRELGMPFSVVFKEPLTGVVFVKLENSE